MYRKGGQNMARQQRCGLLDTVRGLALTSMAAYHLAWDLVYVYHGSLPWFTGMPGYVWQQATCWAFILLSGFCAALAERSYGAANAAATAGAAVPAAPLPHARSRRADRALVLLGAGLVVTAISFFALPDRPIYFGILTFLGTAVLATLALEGLLRRVPARAGLAGSLLLFLLLRDLNFERLGFEGLRLADLPGGWYRYGLPGTFFGFQQANLPMADYYSLLPWLFLFWGGYYACRTLPVLPPWFRRSLEPFAWAGRHSLLLYLLHQPVLYGLLALWFR